MITGVAQSLLKSGENIATQRVVGYSKSVTRTKGKKNPKVIQENLNIGIQAWEIAALIAAAGAYFYFTGNSVSNAALNSMPPIGNIQSNGSYGNLSNPTGVRLI